VKTVQSAVSNETVLKAAALNATGSAINLTVSEAPKMKVTTKLVIVVPKKASIETGKALAEKTKSAAVVMGGSVAEVDDVITQEDYTCSGITAPVNGQAGTCNSTLSAGSSCVPICNPGYTSSGDTLCTAGNTTPTVCQSTTTTTTAPPTTASTTTIPSTTTTQATTTAATTSMATTTHQATTTTTTAGKTALLLVDVQDCFLDANTTSGKPGSLSVPAHHIVPLINSIRNQKGCLFDEVIRSQDFHPPKHISFGSTHGLAAFSHLNGKGALPLKCMKPTSGGTADAACCPTYYINNESRTNCSSVLCPPQNFQYMVNSSGIINGNKACIQCKSKPESCYDTTSEMWPDHCLQAGDSTFPPSLVKHTDDIIVKKGGNLYVDAYSAFMDNTQNLMTELDAIMQSKNISTLYIAGIATDICVHATVRDAFHSKTGKYIVKVIKDATAAVQGNKANYDKAIQEMEDFGATLVTTADVLKMECPTTTTTTTKAAISTTASASSTKSASVATTTTTAAACMNAIHFKVVNGSMGDCPSILISGASCSPTCPGDKELYRKTSCFGGKVTSPVCKVVEVGDLVKVKPDIAEKPYHYKAGDSGTVTVVTSVSYHILWDQSGNSTNVSKANFSMHFMLVMKTTTTTTSGAAACSTTDGSGLSSAYPCSCGTATCTASQKCTSSKNTCQAVDTSLLVGSAMMHVPDRAAILFGNKSAVYQAAILAAMAKSVGIPKDRLSGTVVCDDSSGDCPTTTTTSKAANASTAAATSTADATSTGATTSKAASSSTAASTSMGATTSAAANGFSGIISISNGSAANMSNASRRRLLVDGSIAGATTSARRLTSGKIKVTYTASLVGLPNPVGISIAAAKLNVSHVQTQVQNELTATGYPGAKDVGVTSWSARNPDQAPPPAPPPPPAEVGPCKFYTCGEGKQNKSGITPDTACQGNCSTACCEATSAIQDSGRASPITICASVLVAIIARFVLVFN
jgi:nicotinamidase-related amidase